jgi:hypothetical protein
MAKKKDTIDGDDDRMESLDLNENDASDDDSLNEQDGESGGEEPSCFDEIVDHICEGIQDFFGGIADFIEDLSMKL